MRFISILVVSFYLINFNNTSWSKKDKVDKPEHSHNERLKSDSKIELDEIAKKGISNMELQLKTLNNKTNITSKDYNKLAFDLKKEVDFILNKCTMKGLGHEKLHLFLGEILDNIDTLKSNDLNKGNKALKKLVNLFKNYKTKFS